jgi:hypothetical protein
VRVRSAGTSPWLGLAASAKQIDSSGQAFCGSAD